MEKKILKSLFGMIFLIAIFLSFSFVSAADNPITTTSGDLDSKEVKKPSTVSQSNVIKSSQKVTKYVKENKKLPNSVKVSGYTFSMPEFLYLMSKTIDNKNKKVDSQIKVKYNVKNPSNPTGTGSVGKIYSYYYSQYASKIVKTIDKKKKAPDYIVTAGKNKLQYQSVIYLFAKVLSSTKKTLPYYVPVNITRSTSYNQYIPQYIRPNLPVNSTMMNIGDNSRGRVDLIGPIGDPTSPIRIAYIIGIHPLEGQAHNSLYTNLLKAKKNLRYQYFIYKITVTDNPSDYATGRMNGQMLANKYVLPHIQSNKYNLVVDVHSNLGTRGGNYKKTNFIFAPLNSKPSKTIATKIIKQIPGLSYYFPESQTSPEYITNPLVQSGIKTIIYETYGYETKATTDKYMTQLITNVDNLKL